MGQSQGKPCRYRPAALADLEDIWSFTAQRWLPDQPDAYVTDLAAAIDRLFANPGIVIVRERKEFTPPVRIYNFKAHIMVFRDERDPSTSSAYVMGARTGWATSRTPASPATSTHLLSESCRGDASRGACVKH